MAPDLPQPLSADFEQLRRDFGFPGDDRVVTRCFAVFSGIVGAISLEVFGQYGADTVSNPRAVFDAQVRLLLGMLTRSDADSPPLRSPN